MFKFKVIKIEISFGVGDYLFIYTAADLLILIREDAAI